MNIFTMPRKSWKIEFSNLLEQGKYTSKEDALAAVEVAKFWGWFEDETEYQETIQLVNDYFSN